MDVLLPRRDAQATAGACPTTFLPHSRSSLCVYHLTHLTHSFSTSSSPRDGDNRKQVRLDHQGRSAEEAGDQVGAELEEAVLQALQAQRIKADAVLLQKQDEAGAWHGAGDDVDD